MRRQRLEVAVEVGEPARAALQRVVASLQDEHPALRWNGPSQWYVTFVEVGAVEEQRLERVDRVVEETVAASPPFRPRLTGRSGMYTNGDLFARVTPHPGLSELASELAHRLQAEGVQAGEVQGDLHCTLATAPRGSRLPTSLLGGFSSPAVDWPVRRVVLVRSRLRLGGPVREVRSTHPLAAASRQPVVS